VYCTVVSPFVKTLHFSFRKCSWRLLSFYHVRSISARVFSKLNVRLYRLQYHMIYCKHKVSDIKLLSCLWQDNKVQYSLGAFSFLLKDLVSEKEFPRLYEGSHFPTAIVK
jgi:hypothetical protein